MPGILCLICTDDLSKNEASAVVINCGHVYHQCCLDKWLQESSKCPECRRIIGYDAVKRIFFSTNVVDDIPEPVSDTVLMKTIDRLSETAAEKEDKINELMYRLTLSATETHEMIHALSEKIKKVQSLEKTVGERNKKITDMEKKVRTMQVEAKILKNEIKDLKKNHSAKIASMQKDLNAMEQLAAKYIDAKTDLNKSKELTEKLCIQLEQVDTENARLNRGFRSEKSLRNDSKSSQKNHSSKVGRK